jgi:hypothetical protein
MEFINVADMINPSTGKTYREENREKEHKIPLGALVEIVDNEEMEGIRLNVVALTRDCDSTPLYSLGLKNKKGDLTLVKERVYPLQLIEMFHGYGEESLKEIK